MVEFPPKDRVSWFCTLRPHDRENVLCADYDAIRAHFGWRCECPCHEPQVLESPAPR